MSIITISRGSYSKGREIAEKVAQELGYECISRDIILEASEHFNLAEIKLVRAIHDAPSILDKFTHGKEGKIDYMRLSLLRHFQKNNVVYHGLAGHFFVKDIPHVLKVRIIADMEDRVRFEMEREKITREEALRILKNDDEQRRKWSRHLYGIDTKESSLYDLVIHIKKVKVHDAVDIICHTVNLESFRTTPESQAAMNDLVLAAEVKSELVGSGATVEVAAKDGVILLSKTAKSKRLAHSEEIEEIVRKVPGVVDVKYLEPTQTDYSNPWHKI